MDQQRICKKHYNEVIIMWCFTCDVLVCCECIESNHDCHSLKTLKNIDKFKMLQNSSSSIDTTSSITSNDNINNINDNNITYLSPPQSPQQQQQDNYIQQPGQYHLPPQQTSTFVKPKPLPTVPVRPVPLLPQQQQQQPNLYPQMINQNSNLQQPQQSNLYPQQYNNNNNNNNNNLPPPPVQQQQQSFNNNLQPQQSFNNNLPPQQSYNNNLPPPPVQQPYNSVSAHPVHQPYNNLPQQYYQQPQQSPQQSFSNLPQQSPHQFYIPPYNGPITTPMVQSSTVPPPPPSLILPIPQIILIKKEKYDTRIQSDMDQEFQNALYARDAVKLIKKLSERGHSSSQAWLGASYLYGNNGCKVNNDKANKWLKKASDQDHPKGCYDYFKYYEKIQDSTKASILLEKSSNLGYEDGIGRYAHYLYQQQNYSKSFETFKLAAALGVDNYNCFTYLGLCFYDGTGVPVDYNEAYRFFYTSSVQYNDSISFFYLAQCLYYGHGVEQNQSLSVQWLQKSSDTGIGYGTNGLGLCYLRGDGVTQDFSKAKQLFTKAKTQNPLLDIDSNLKAADKCIQHKSKPKDYNKYIQENLDQQKLKAKLKSSKSKNNNSNDSNNNNTSASDILDTIGSTIDVASSVFSFFSDDN